MLFVLAALISTQADTVKPDCSGSTHQMNLCMSEKLERADRRLQQYVQAAVARHTEESGKFDSVVLGIRASQTAFEAYREIECDSVLEEWKEGTIRGVMTLDCKLDLTNQRTRTVWANWLQYMDSTPPILPEPLPIE